jgi:hypothetical protein
LQGCLLGFLCFLPCGKAYTPSVNRVNQRLDLHRLAARKRLQPSIIWLCCGNVKVIYEEHDFDD